MGRLSPPMTAILVVCTGNVCRSPIAEGLLRVALEARLGAEAPRVASAGTMGWTCSAADPGSVAAAAGRGVDISSHRARELEPAQIARSGLILGMATEHTRAVVTEVPEARSRSFTLKELVRLVEAMPETFEATPERRLFERVAAADRLRASGFAGDPSDEGVADPLGMPPDAFRAVAAELDEWCSRLTDGLFGRAEARAATGTSSR
jgi:protein-tyrosine phosphatase